MSKNIWQIFWTKIFDIAVLGRPTCRPHSAWIPYRLTRSRCNLKMNMLFEQSVWTFKVPLKFSEVWLPNLKPELINAFYFMQLKLVLNLKRLTR